MSNYFYCPQASNLAEKLCTLTGFSKVCFGNSGAEANECAIKVARKYSFDKYGADRNEIITLNNSFHGRTVTTLRLQDKMCSTTTFPVYTGIRIC